MSIEQVLPNQRSSADQEFQGLENVAKQENQENATSVQCYITPNATSFPMLQYITFNTTSV